MSFPAELLPEAELVEFEGVTHMGPMMLKKEGRPVFERYVAWLSGISRGETLKVSKS